MPRSVPKWVNPYRLTRLGTEGGTGSQCDQWHALWRRFFLVAVWSVSWYRFPKLCLLCGGAWILSSSLPMAFGCLVQARHLVDLLKVQYTTPKLYKVSHKKKKFDTVCLIPIKIIKICDLI